MTTAYVRAKSCGQFSLKPMKPILGKVPTVAAQLRVRANGKAARPILGQGQQIALRDGRANAATLRAVGRP